MTLVTPRNSLTLERFNLTSRFGYGTGSDGKHPQWDIAKKKLTRVISFPESIPDSIENEKKKVLPLILC